jgi:hypothetical protein
MKHLKLLCSYLAHFFVGCTFGAVGGFLIVLISIVLNRPL